MLNLLFFGQLKERLKCDKLQLEIDQPMTISQLKVHLVDLNPCWRTWLLDTQLLAAVNQSLCGTEHIVNITDEVAFFPPVTGG